MHISNRQIRSIRLSFLFTLLIIAYGFLSYNYFGGWYDSSIGTIAIVIISYLIWKNNFLSRIGLKLNPKKIIKTATILSILLVANYLIIKYLANKQNIQISLLNWRSYYHIFFYTLNEEIIVGALPLFALARKKSIGPVAAIIGLAVIFSLMHFVFYKWVFDDRGNIELTTLITLFFIGIVRNDLIIRTGHIGYSWALHFSWVAIMFGTFQFYSGSESGLSERTRFNTYLGSTEMLIISCLLVGMVMASWIFNVKKNSGTGG